MWEDGMPNPWAFEREEEEKMVWRWREVKEKCGSTMYVISKLFRSGCIRLNDLIYFTYIRSNLDYHTKTYNMI